MFDRDLAELYGVSTGNLNKAVKRNIERFPGRFMFQLTKEEALRFQFGTLNDEVEKLGRGKHFKYLPYAFTEQGVSMLSAVLRSPTAIQVSISIMDAFVAMRNYIMQSSVVSAELAEMRSRLQLIEHEVRENLKAMNEMSEDIGKDVDALYEAIGALSVKLPKAKMPRQQIGFKTGDER